MYGDIEKVTESNLNLALRQKKIITMMRKGKTHFVVVYLTEVEENQPQKLLGVPQAPSGKGKDESKVVREMGCSGYGGTICV